MNRHLTYAVFVFATMCLSFHTVCACPTYPYVYISNWIHYVPLGGSVEIRANEYSGTYITDWDWWYSSGVSETDYDDDYGTYPSSSHTFSFSLAGTKYIYAEAENTYWLTDSDYAKVYVVEVSSVEEDGTGATSITVPVGESVSLKAYPYPSVSWFSGWPTWSIQSQPSGASASITAGSSGTATLSDMDIAGLYRPKAVCGSADDGATMDVTAIDVQIDTTFPKAIPPGAPLALACTPKPDGITGGVITWSKVSGPGDVTFSPDEHAEDPTFSATVPGTYEVQVQYTQDDASVTRTSGTISVPTVSITAPSPFPDYVARGVSTQLDCTPTPAGGSYHWSQIYGTGSGTFAESTDKDPDFTGTAAGSFVLQVQYILHGVTVSDTKSTTIVGVDITAPEFPAYVGVNQPIQLDCTPSEPGGAYSWSIVSGPPTGSFSDAAAKDPTFTASSVGAYTVQVQYTLNGVVVTAISGEINVFGVQINAPSSFPAYVGMNDPLQLECVPIGPVGSDSAYSWSIVSGPPTGGFSSTTVRTPTFTTPAVGTYILQVQYTTGGSTTTATSGEINVFGVQITTPSAFPAYVGVNDPLQLVCVPMGPVGSDGAYSWSIVSGPPTGGFSSTTVRTPTFTTPAVGTYILQVQYTTGGATTTATSGEINIFGVQITTPSTFPVYAGAGSPLQLVCVPTGPAGIGAYNWSKLSGSGEVIFSDANDRTPTFTAAVAGNYTVKVTYTVADVNVSDTSGVISVVRPEIYLDVNDANEGYVELGEVRPLTLSIEPQDPNLLAGQGILQAIAGGEKIKVWLEQEKITEVNLPATLPLSQWPVPITLWAEGTALSSTWNDVQLKWSFCDPMAQPVAENTLGVTVVPSMDLSTISEYVDALDPNKTVEIDLVTDVNAIYTLGGTLQLEGASGYEPNQVRIWWTEGGQRIDVNLPYIWDLSDPNVTIPELLNADFIAPVGTRQDMTLALLYGREPNLVVTMDQQPFIQIQVRIQPVIDDPLWQGNWNLEPGVAKPVQLQIVPMPTHGFIRLDANDGSDYVHLWADQAGTQPLPLLWNLPGQSMPPVVYAEGVSGGENERVTLNLAFHEEPRIASDDTTLSEPPFYVRFECMAYNGTSVNSISSLDWQITVHHQPVRDNGQEYYEDPGWYQFPLTPDDDKPGDITTLLCSEGTVDTYSPGVNPMVCTGDWQDDVNPQSSKMLSISDIGYSATSGGYSLMGCGSSANFVSISDIAPSEEQEGHRESHFDCDGTGAWADWYVSWSKSPTPPGPTELRIDLDIDSDNKNGSMPEMNNVEEQLEDQPTAVGKYITINHSVPMVLKVWGISGHPGCTITLSCDPPGGVAISGVPLNPSQSYSATSLSVYSVTGLVEGSYVITATPTPGAGQPDSVRVKVTLRDVDSELDKSAHLDSGHVIPANDSDQDMTGGMPTEYVAPDEVGAEIVVANNSVTDDDGDGTPDHLDYANASEKDFGGFSLNIRDLGFTEDTRVAFSYSSDIIRVWTKAGDVMRNPASVDEGDYVPSGTQLYPEYVGLGSWLDPPGVYSPEPSSASFFVEGLAVGQTAIRFYADLDSNGTANRKIIIPVRVVPAVIVTVRDPQVNGVCSGLKRESLVIKLNGDILLPSSEVVVTDICTSVDGVDTLTELQIGIARWVLGEGTSLLRIEIDDNVGNRTISEREFSMP